MASQTRPLKRLFVGRRIASSKAEHQLLPKFLALPVFSSDALSSVAYATEEMMLVLVVAGAGALALKIPIALAIAALLAIVVTSYRQTVRAYPMGGGSYIVAKENIGTIPGLVAAAAILADYVLTVAVSVTAGTIAVTSAAPGFAKHRVAIAIGFIVLIAIANLRGVKEAGKLFAVPTYGFVAMVYLALAIGFAQCLTSCHVATSAGIPLEPEAGLTLFLLLRAFASGATALTGVEAIADGVQAFRRPRAKNAAATLAIMGAIAISMFLGITLITHVLRIRVNPSIALSRSVLSQVGETVFGRSALFYLLQVFTAGILVLAANTSFQDFPRLSSILARDRFMPSQFRNRGDRLVFSNGVIVLAAIAGLTVYVFHGELTRLIQLYVVGVFTAFTLSQAGMVRRWVGTREDNWRRSAIINGIGATATGVVLVIVTVTKFTRGAWVVIAVIPLLVAMFIAIHRHYGRVAELLRAGGLTAETEARNSFVLLVRELDASTAQAIAYLRALRPERVAPLYIGNPRRFAEVAHSWREVAPRLGDLLMLPGADRQTTRSIHSYLRERSHSEDEFVTVMIPERLSGGPLVQLVRHRSELWLKASLLFSPGVVVTDVPLHPEEAVEAAEYAKRPLEPERSVVLIPVSAVHDATVRAVTYAKALHATEIEALFFAADPEEIDPVVQQWAERRIDIPLAVVEAPFRDIGAPLLAEVRKHTSRGDTVVTVVLPEFVVHRWWEHLLHNQTGLYLKRQLLFEPHVVVTSVPFHLRAASSHRI